MDEEYEEDLSYELATIVRSALVYVAGLPPRLQFATDRLPRASGDDRLPEAGSEADNHSRLLRLAVVWTSHAQDSNSFDEIKDAGFDAGLIGNMFKDDDNTG